MKLLSSSTLKKKAILDPFPIFLNQLSCDWVLLANKWFGQQVGGASVFSEKVDAHIDHIWALFSIKLSGSDLNRGFRQASNLSVWLTGI